MKKSIEQKRAKLLSMIQGGMYNRDYLLAQRKLLVAELMQENEERVKQLRADFERKLQALKDKYKFKELPVDELERFKTKLRALKEKELLELSGEGLTADEIYSIAAELRNRNKQLDADRFMTAAAVKNLLEPFKNDAEYSKLIKSEAVIKIMEGGINHCYYEFEESQPLNIKGVINFDSVFKDIVI